MFSKILIFEILPNILETLVTNRKKIVVKAKKKTKKVVEARIGEKKNVLICVER